MYILVDSGNDFLALKTAFHFYQLHISIIGSCIRSALSKYMVF